MISLNGCTAMMKAEVNNKHEPFKKTSMTMESRSNVVPMMTLLALSFILEKRHTWIISILDFHVMTIFVGRREAQHIPRIDLVFAFSFLIHLYRKNKQYVCKKGRVVMALPFFVNNYSI